MAGRRKRLPARVLRALGLTLGAVLLAAVFYVAVVLASPQEPEETVAAQPLLAPSAPLSLTSQEQLAELVAAFAAPVMAAAQGSDLHLVAASSYDAAFEGGYGRIALLVYETEDAVRLEVQSIYPARALGLLPGSGWHLSARQGDTLAGMEAVRMENGTSLRLHTQGEEGLYTITIAKGDTARLAELTRPLQLMRLAGSN